MASDRVSTAQKHETCRGSEVENSECSGETEEQSFGAGCRVTAEALHIEDP